MSKTPTVKPKYLLLDTHIWIWLMNGSDELNRKEHLSLIEQYARRDALRICAISVWELGMLVAKNRLTLSKAVSHWVKESLKGHGLTLEPLSVDILLESTQMGDEAHGDPADRLILTTAKNIRAALMTADARMISYCQRHNLPVEPIQ